MNNDKNMKRAELDQSNDIVDSVKRANKEDPSRFYKVVNVTPGRLEGLRKMGYREEDASLLEDSLQMQSIANQFEMGRVKGSQKAVVVSCPKADWDARQVKLKKEQDALLSDSIEGNTFDGQDQPRS